MNDWAGTYNIEKFPDSNYYILLIYRIEKGFIQIKTN